MLKVLNLHAPDGEHAINPRGRTVVSGPTGTGKSQLYAAHRAHLTGDALSLRGPVAGESTRTHTDGTVTTIRQTPSGSRKYTIARSGTSTDYTAVGAYRTALGGAADPKHDDILRAVQEHGRALSLHPDELVAVLAKVTPTDDLLVRIARMAGVDESSALLSCGVSPKHADYPEKMEAALLVKQTAANRTAAQDEGKLSTATTTLDKLRAAPVAPVDEDQLRADRETIAAEDAWQAYDRDTAAYTAALATIAKQQTAAAEWATKRAALTAPDAQAHTDALARIDTRIEEARALVARLEAEERVAQEAARAEAARVQAEADKAAAVAEVERKALDAARAEMDRQRQAAEAELARVRAEAVAEAARQAAAEQQRRAEEAAPATLFPTLTPSAPVSPDRCPTCGQTWSR